MLNFAKYYSLNVIISDLKFCEYYCLRVIMLSAIYVGNNFLGVLNGGGVIMYNAQLFKVLFPFCYVIY
jgi:hypothetical protein